jgi:hypothetical protein
VTRQTKQMAGGEQEVVEGYDRSGNERETRSRACCGVANPAEAQLGKSAASGIFYMILNLNI